MVVEVMDTTECGAYACVRDFPSFTWKVASSVAASVSGIFSTASTSSS